MANGSEHLLLSPGVSWVFSSAVVLAQRTAANRRSAVRQAAGRWPGQRQTAVLQSPSTTILLDHGHQLRVTPSAFKIELDP